MGGSLSLTKTASHPRQILDTSHVEKLVNPGKKTQKIAMIVAKPPAAACEAFTTPPGENLERMGFVLPSVALLNEKKATHTRVDGVALREKGQILENKLKDFGIAGEVVEILPGPVITTFEYRPAPGVKISKIVNLTDDLALAQQLATPLTQAGYQLTQSTTLHEPFRADLVVYGPSHFGEQDYREYRQHLRWWL